MLNCTTSGAVNRSLEECQMPRPFASGSIAFGLVSIPVKLYSATEATERISFNMIHTECGSRIQQQLFCPKDERTISREETSKGYEFAKGQYVLFTEEELKAMEEKATQTIEISEFLPREAIDPIYFQKANYMSPDKGGDRAYALLAKALEEPGRTRGQAGAGDADADQDRGEAQAGQADREKSVSEARKPLESLHVLYGPGGLSNAGPLTVTDSRVRRAWSAQARAWGARRASIRIRRPGHLAHRRRAGRKSARAPRPPRPAAPARAACGREVADRRAPRDGRRASSGEGGG